MEIFVLEFDDGSNEYLGSRKKIPAYHFDLDDGKGYCNRSRRSHNAFFYGKKNRNIKYERHVLGTDVVIHSCYTYDNYTENELRDAVKRFSFSCDVIQLKNIWEFYKEIEYDHRKKRWGFYEGPLHNNNFTHDDLPGRSPLLRTVSQDEAKKYEIQNRYMQW